jgi:hypothetical protein
LMIMIFIGKILAVFLANVVAFQPQPGQIL